MTRDELLARLQSIEWSDIEFKEATWAVPKDALSTVSAFANTEGGHLVFGVRQANGAFTVAGVTEALDTNIQLFLKTVGIFHHLVDAAARDNNVNLVHIACRGFNRL